MMTLWVLADAFGSSPRHCARRACHPCRVVTSTSKCSILNRSPHFRAVAYKLYIFVHLCTLEALDVPQYQSRSRATQALGGLWRLQSGGGVLLLGALREAQFAEAADNEKVKYKVCR